MKNFRVPAIILGAIIYVFAMLCIVLPKDDISESERRKLAEFPKFSLESFMSGKFAKDFEEYATDNFPFRDAFRTIKSSVNFDVFQKSDNNDIYIYKDSMMKLEKDFDEKSAANALSKFNSLYEKYISGKTDKVYISIVPDKAYFAWKDGKNIPSLDYDELFEYVKDGTPWAQYIDVTDTLSLSDFYKTDSHWRQEKISATAEKIMSEMGYTLSDKYTEVDAGIDFRGVYSGQAAKPGASENLVYLINDTLSDCKVTNFETGKSDVGIYDMEKLSSRDPYEVFLSGACAALSIENPNAKNDRELVIFRDSYGSSIAPLFIENYSKVTLLDIRYMNPEFVGNFASFENADVLFLYSSTLINSSSALR